mgnify:CR=1 FL=1
MSHNKRGLNWVARLFRQRRGGPCRPESLQRRLNVERLEDRVAPATIVWTGAGSNSLWSTPQNWDLGRAPQAGDDIVFSNLAPTSSRTPVYNLTGSPTFNSITIAASGYTISAATSTPTITLGGPITVGVNLGTITLSSNLQLTPPTSTLQQTITVNSGSTLVLSGQLSGYSNTTLAAQQTLTKAGAGVLELSGDNSAYIGAFVLANNGGIVVISHQYALGTGAVISGAPTAGETTVNVGAQLQVRSIAQAIPARLRLNGNGPTGTGALYNLAGNNTWAGPVILDSDSTIGGAAGTSLNIRGLISDTGAGRNLTKEGGTTLIFSRVGGNTYRGQTIINDGILRIQDPLSLGAGATFGTPQHNTPQAGVIVNYNSITGAAGTLQLEFTGSLGTNDPNGILLNPNQPFHPTNNPYIGFQVYNQLLTLNGPGYGSIGALSNLAGQNIWSGNITLGSPFPASGAVSIGAESGSSLILSGVLSDPNRQPNLQKVRSGRVILNNANTYTGGTTVLAGALNIRDSKALGTGSVSVTGGATLELEVDTGIDGTPLRNNNRNLGFDSVVGSQAPGVPQGQEIAVSGTSGTFTLSFKGQTTAPLAYNATATDIQNALNSLSTITAGGGSVTVTQVGSIFRVTFNGALGSGNQPLITASASGGVSVTISPIYGLQVANNLSITGNGLNNTGALRSISGINRWTGNINTGEGGGSIGVEMDNRPGHPTAGADYFTYDYSLTVTGTISGSSLTKLRPGHLILPTGNTYSGNTNIQQGWITIQNSSSLGNFASNIPITQRPNVVISSGAALHIRGGVSGMTESHNYIISGSGISHPYDKLDQNGAVLNLTGVNTLNGIIRLNGIAGIGVEQLPPPAPQQSQLRLTGYTWDNGNTIGSLVKLGTQRLVIQSPGTYRGDVTIAEGVLLVQNDTALGAPGTGTVTVQSGAALEIANSVTEQNGGVLNGLGIWGKALVLHGSGNPAFNAATLTILTGTSPATDPVGLVPLTAADHMWRGPVTLASDVTIKVEPNARLTILGDIGEQPNADAGITLTGGGVLNLLGSNTYGGTTWINQGVLTIGNGSALGTPGHPELQTITLTGATAGTTQFTLTFNGQTTSPILYSGDGPTDAAAIQAALNALSTIGGAPTVGGQVTVAPLTPGVFRVSLGGSLSGFDQPLMSGAVTTGPGSINITETRRGGGGTVIAQGASLQLAGSFTVAGEPLLVNGSGSSVVPNLPVQWFQIGPAPVTNGPTPGNSDVIGRVTATAVDPRDSNIMYMALAGGGVWKTIDGGRTWRQIFDAIPEIQEVTVGSSTNFTLTFGPDTTPLLSGSSTAAQVQAALNALPSIANEGGNVTVTRRTQGGNVIFQITFGGTLAGYDVPQLVSSAGTVATVQQGRDPRFAMFIGSIVLDPRDPDIIYVGTGEANNSPDSFYGTGIYRSTDGGLSWQVFAGTDPLFYGKGVVKIIIDPNQGNPYSNPFLYVSIAEGGNGVDEIQEIRPNLPTGTQFTLTFTGPDSTGNIVSLTTNPITYDNRNQVNPSDPFGRTYRQITADTIAAELNALANIGGIGGNVTVTPSSGGGPGSNRYRITFGGTLSQSNVQQLTTNFQLPPNVPSIGVSTIRQGGPPGVINGTPGNAGVWRYSGGSWVNLTSSVSTWRSSKETPQSVPPTDGAYRIADGGNGRSKIPNTPGPDDDYRMMFPQTNVVWSDIALVYADRLNGGNQWIPILYAALGTPRGDVNNAVFWTQNPMSDTPRWFVGDPGGSPFNNYDPTASPPQPRLPDGSNSNDQPDQGRNTGFPRGIFQQWSTSTNNWNPTSPSPVNGTIKISAAVNSSLFSTNANGRFNQIVLYAAVANPNGALQAVYRTTNGGRDWTNVTGNLPNYLFNIGFFSNALLVVDANTAFIGGQGVDAQGNQTLWMTTNGGGSWTNISVGANGVGPHAGAHHITRDGAGRIIVSTDGGVWRWDGSNWTNLNGNVAGAQVLGLAGHPTNVSQAYVGALSNGVAQFNNSQTWPRVFGSSAGRVAVDPLNPNNVYAVIKSVGATDAVYRSTDGGQNWTTLLPTTGSTNTPLVLDPINPSRILVGGSQLRVSLNQGVSWITLRGGVVQGIAIAQTQGTYTLDPDFLDVADKGSNSYDPDTIYITDGTSIYLTKNGGLTWVDRTGDVSGGGIVDIVVNPRNRDEVYIVRSFLGQNQVWRSTDAGQNWEEIGTANGLPEIPVWKVVVDPRNNNVYIGTDIGVFVLRGGPTSGNRWQRFGIGMPNVQVRDLELNLTTNTLLAGTYGRSVYQMFLDTNWTAATPLAASVVGLSGRTVWAGPVILNDTSLANQVTVGAYGIPNLPNPRANASVNFNGSISDLTPTSSPTLRKIGNGDVVFSGTNIYGGATRVLQGALIVDNDQALGRTTNGTTVDTGAVLQLRSNLGPEPITLNGHGQSFDGHFTGALRNIAGDNTYTGTLILATDSTIGVDSGSSLTIGQSPNLPGSGSINGGSFTLNKELLGTLVLAGSNSLGGPLNVYQGALRIGDSNALSSSNTVTVLNGAQIQLADTNGSPISVGANLNISGTGIFGTGAIRNISGNNTWSGNITLQELPGFAPIAVPPGVVSVAVDRPQDTLTLSGTVGELAVSPPIPMGLEKIGPGRLTLSANNTYSGATEIYAGTLQVRHNNALGNRTNTTTVQRLVIVSEARQGEVVLNFAGQQTVVDWQPNDAPNASAIQTAINGMISAAGLSGSVTVTRQEIASFEQSGSRGIIGGEQGYAYAYTITFGGGLATTNLPLTAFGRNGAEAMATFVGRGGVNVRVWDGATLELNSSGSDLTIANKHLILDGTGVGRAGALRNLAGNNTWDGPVLLTSDSRIDVVGSSLLTLNGGVLSGSGELRKLGNGTLQFPSGTPANNQSRTVIDAGVVEVLGTLGPVQLNSGTLQGPGTVGALTVTSSGGAVRPGDTVAGNSVGTLNAGNTTWNSQTTLFVDLVSTTSHDRLSVTGNIDLGSATLTGTAATSSINIGDAFTIIQTTGGTITGQFAGPSTSPTLAGANRATIVYIGGVKFVVNYFNNQVVLTRELANVSIQLATSVTSPVYGQPFTVIATLTSEPLAPLPSGSVTFTYTDPDSNIHTQTVTIDSSGQAAFDPTQWGPLELGTHNFLVNYNGQDSSNQQVFNPASATLDVDITAAPTTTTLTGPSSPPSYGQDFTLTATVASTINPRISGTFHPPQGTVSFYQGSTLLATVALDSSGVATLNTGTLSPPPAAGPQTFTAVYNGDGSPPYYLSSTSNTLNYDITKANSTTTILSSINPSVYGEPVTFTATVTGITGGATPTGTVVFRRGSLILGTGTLNASGVATYTTTLGQLPVSTGLIITAEYQGDGNYNSSSASLTQQVIKANTSINLNQSPDPSVYGQPVTFTATVLPVSPGAGTPTGSVTFLLGSTVLGTANLVGGVASFTTTAFQLPVGNLTITAQYSGSPQFNSSTNTITHTVNPAATTTTLASATNPAVYGQAVTFTAIVAPVSPGAGVPTGTVEFYLGSTLLGTGTLDVNGAASYTTTVGQLPVGTGQTITAHYLGSTNYSASSGSLSQDVNKADTSAVITASFHPSGIDQPVTFTAMIQPVSPGGGNPTGTVNFFYNGNPLGSAAITVVDGVSQAIITAAANTLPFGTGTVSVTYAGDSNFNGTSGSASHTVLNGTTTTLISLTNPSVYGQPVTFRATVNPTVGSVVPTGTVTFRLGSTILGTASLNNGVATLTTAPFDLPVGNSVAITAIYNGDTLFAQSAGTFLQTVNPASTRTVLFVRPSRAVSWEAVRLEARVGAVSPGGGVPTGLVVFRDVTRNRVLGGAMLDGGGVAVLWSHVGGPLGVHRVRAEYVGDGSYGGSVSGLVGVEVVGNGDRSSRVVLRSSRNPSNVGVPVTFVAVVRDGVDGSVTPGGTVGFYGDGVLLGYGVLRRVREGVSRAELEVSGLGVGWHEVVARYSGSEVYARGVSEVLWQEVRPAATRASRVVLGVSPGSPTVYGQRLELSAEVEDGGPAPALTPTGVVRFVSDGVEVGRGVLVGVGVGVSRAVLTVTSLGVGLHELKAEYLGDVDFAGGVWSDVVLHEVGAVGSEVEVGGVGNPSRYGGEVELRAVVRALSPSEGVAMGQVVFRDVSEGVVLGSAVLDGLGVARLRVGGLGVGVHRIEAEYLGDGNVLGGVGVYDQVVLRSRTGVSLSRSTGVGGRRLELVARVVALPPGGGVPGGVVRFIVDGVERGVGVLDSRGVARLVLARGLGVGRHVVRAVYDGDGNYLGSATTVTWDFTIGRNT